MDGVLSWKEGGIRYGIRKIQLVSLLRFVVFVVTDVYSLCDGDCDVVDGEAPLEEEVLSHVGQRRRRVDRVATHAVPFQVRSRVAALK